MPELAPPRRVEVAVLGAGVAGAIAARVLARQGRAVVLLERERHPRFALGESSTPLAAIALERLAARFDLPDLHQLAAYGRWSEALPELRRGLKRGFTFYAHRPGEPFRDSREEPARLLVAASPNDRIADAHWLRSDVDRHLTERAAAAGALVCEETDIDAVAELVDGVELAGLHRPSGRRFRTHARFVVDASGGRGALASHLPIAPAARSAIDTGLPSTGLIGGHFEGVEDFAPLARRAPGKMGADFPEGLPPGPYPDDRAAVHHLLDIGWMYQLPFDHGVTSLGFVVRADAPRELHPATAGVAPMALFERLAGRYPTLARQLAAARPVAGAPPDGPLQVARLGHRLARAAGRRWLLLPGSFAFTDPLFSTGIAWSLLGVERLASLCAGGTPAEADLARYGDLLAVEADHIDRLIALAYRTMGDFRLFVPVTLLYFAAASFAEARQRLLPRPPREVGEWAWEGFLGADDPVIGEALAWAERHLDRLLDRLLETAGGSGRLERAEAERFGARLRQAIAPRDVAGFSEPPPAGRPLYPVRFEPLVAGAAKLGLSAAEVEAALPRLRG